jgi:hypothetical protein
MEPTEFDGENAAERDASGPALRARTTTHDDGTVACTIYPAEASEDRRTTRWITAKEDSYVELCRMR